MRLALGGSTGTLLLIAALGGGSLGCGADPLGAPRVCTAIGCGDEFVATVTVDATMVPGGTHTVGVTVDGATTFCAFLLPPDPGFDNPPCSAGFALSVQPAELCTTVQTDATTSQQCQPIDGKFTETIMVLGTPHSLEVQQQVGGTVIFDQTVSPTYQANDPNGPGCGPICQQATAAWTIPE